jgi:large subunit ribosomal protein L25
MAGERIKLVVAHRDTLGSPESRRLRKQGLIPGVLYGRNEPISICVQERELRRALTTSAGLHAILDVQVDGKGTSHASIVKDYQVDKIRGHVTHVDLQEVRLDQPIHAAVTVHLIGGEDAPGVREGGVLSQPLRELNVAALPLEVPEHVDVDVTQLEMNGTLRVADVTVPDGVTLLDDPETVVATVTAPTREVAPEEELEGAEAAALEGESEGETPEGADAPSEAASESGADAAGDQGTVEG